MVGSPVPVAVVVDFVGAAASVARRIAAVTTRVGGAVAVALRRSKGNCRQLHSGRCHPANTSAQDEAGRRKLVTEPRRLSVCGGGGDGKEQRHWLRLFVGSVWSSTVVLLRGAAVVPLVFSS